MTEAHSDVPIMAKSGLNLDMSILQSSNSRKESPADSEPPPARIPLRNSLSIGEGVNLSQSHRKGLIKKRHRLGGHRESSLLQSGTMRQRIADRAPKSKAEYVRTLFMAIREDSVPYIKAILNPHNNIKVAKSHHKKVVHNNALQDFFAALTKEVTFGAMDHDLLDLTDDEDRNALHIACLYNAVDCVEYLLTFYEAVLDSDVQVTKRESSGGCMGKTYSMDAFVNGRDKYGNTPLVMASKCFVREADHTALLQVVYDLLEHGADLSIETKTGDTVLHWAARQNLHPLVNLLLIADQFQIERARVTHMDQVNQEAKLEDVSPQSPTRGSEEKEEEKEEEQRPFVHAELVQMDYHGVAISARVVLELPESEDFLTVRPLCQWVQSPQEIFRLLMKRNHNKFTPLELTGTNFFRARVNEYMGNTHSVNLQYLVAESKQCTLEILKHSLGAGNIHGSFTNDEEKQLDYYQRRCIFFGALLGGETGVAAVTRNCSRERVIDSQKSCLGMTPFHIASFTGHDYIFEILLDAYLPERGTTMHPTSPSQSQHAAVHPIDETARARATSKSDNKWAHLKKKASNGKVVPQANVTTSAAAGTALETNSVSVTNLDAETEHSAAASAKVAPESNTTAPHNWTVGTEVIIVKEGSKYGRRCVVTDPDWQGMVKVNLGGAIKSYKPNMLELAPPADVLEVGTEVIVVKVGSSKYGRRCVVTDPKWKHGMVKVNMDGDIKSYDRHALEVAGGVSPTAKQQKTTHKVKSFDAKEIEKSAAKRAKVVPAPNAATKATGQRPLGDGNWTVGTAVFVVKEGSSKYGRRCVVIDPDWQGMVKVDMGGAIKSYHRDALARAGTTGRSGDRASMCLDKVNTLFEENTDGEEAGDNPSPPRSPKKASSIANVAMMLPTVSLGSSIRSMVSSKEKSVKSFVDNLTKHHDRAIAGKALCVRDRLGNTPLHYAVMKANVGDIEEDKVFVEFLIDLGREHGVKQQMLEAQNDLLLQPSDLAMPCIRAPFEPKTKQSCRNLHNHNKGAARMAGKWRTDLALSLEEDHFPLFLMLWKSLTFPLSGQYSKVIQHQLADRRDHRRQRDGWSELHQIKHSTTQYMNHPGDDSGINSIWALAAKVPTLDTLKLPTLMDDALRIVLRFEPNVYEKLDESMLHSMHNLEDMPTFSTFFFVVEKQKTLLHFKRDVQAAWLLEYGSVFPLSNMEIEFQEGGDPAGARELTDYTKTMEHLVGNTGDSPAIIILREESCVHLKATRHRTLSNHHKVYLILMIKDSRLPFLAMEQGLLCDVMLANKSVPFDIERRHIFAPFTTAQRYLLVNTMIRKLCDVELLERKDVLQSYMAMHQPSEAHRMWVMVCRCGNPINIFDIHFNKRCGGNRCCLWWAALVEYCMTWVTSGSDKKYDTITAIKNYHGQSLGLYFAFVSFYEVWAWILALPTMLIGIAQLIIYIYYLDNDKRSKGDPLSSNATIFDNIVSKVSLAGAGNEGLGGLAIIVAIWATLFVECWKRKQIELLCKWDGLREEKEEFAKITESSGVRVSYNADETFNVTKGKIEKVPPKYDEINKIAMGGWASLCFVIVLWLAFFITLENVKRSKELAFYLLAFLTDIENDVLMRNVNSTWYVDHLFQPMDAENLEQMAANMREALKYTHNDSVLARYLEVKEDSWETGGLLLSFLGSSINGLLVAVLGLLYWELSVFFVTRENHRLQSDYNNSLVLKSFTLQFVNTYASIIYNILSGVEIDKIGIQVMNIMLAKLGTGFVKEQVFPCLKHMCKKDKHRQMGDRYYSGKTAAFDSPFASDHFGPRDFERVLHNEYMEAKKDNDAVYNYLELVIMFGFVAMFSVAFPLAPALAALFVSIEVRMDMVKYSNLMQRVITDPTTGIGIWQDIIRFVSMCAVVFNCLLLLRVTPSLKEFAYNPEKQDEWGLMGTACPLDEQITKRFEREDGGTCLSDECLAAEHTHAQDVCNGTALYIFIILVFWMGLTLTKLILKSCIQDVPTWVKKYVVRSKTEWII